MTFLTWFARIFVKTEISTGYVPKLMRIYLVYYLFEKHKHRLCASDSSKKITRHSCKHGSPLLGAGCDERHSLPVAFAFAVSPRGGCMPAGIYASMHVDSCIASLVQKKGQKNGGGRHF